MLISNTQSDIMMFILQNDPHVSFKLAWSDSSGGEQPRLDRVLQTTEQTRVTPSDAHFKPHIIVSVITPHLPWRVSWRITEDDFSSSTFLREGV